MNTRNNQRFRNMDKKLKSTMLELLKEMDFEKITVKMICQKADVNRSSFYAHYTDIYEIMEQMEEHLNQELLESYSEYTFEENEFFRSGPLSPFSATSKNITIFIRLRSSSGKTFR